MSILGNDDNNNLIGTDGDDIIYAGLGRDIISGGKGSDLLVVDYSTYNNEYKLGIQQFVISSSSELGHSGALDFYNGSTVSSTLARIDFSEIERFNVKGTQYGDTISTGTDADIILAGPGDDYINSGGGNDSIDGGEGVDQVMYSGVRSNYTFAASATKSKITIHDMREVGDGTDTITGVEYFKFTDITLALTEIQDEAKIMNQSAMDLTGDGVVDSTDALIMMRNLIGTFPGASLVNGVNIVGNTSQLQQRIADVMEKSSAFQGVYPLDIDGDGIINPLSDGLAITQYIHGKGRPGGMPQMPDVFKNPIRGFEEMQNHLKDLIGF